MDRRQMLQAASAASVLGLTAGCASLGGGAGGKVVVVGGGYGGATAAKYIRKWDPRIEVLLVERNERFVSCPISNLVLGGVKRLEDITLGYDGLSRYGIRQVRDEILATYLADTAKARILLPDGRYERVTPLPGAPPFNAQEWLLRTHASMSQDGRRH